VRYIPFLHEQLHRCSFFVQNETFSYLHYVLGTENWYTGRGIAMYTIQIDGLSKKYKKLDALKDVNLNLPPGIHGLLGPNGAGKTTLMNILTTLLQPTAGKVTIFGHDLEKNGHRIRELLGYMPQHVYFPGQLTTSEFLHYAASMKGIERPEARKQEVERVLEEVNLTEHAGKKIKGLSGGMKQRLGIAQAILGDPKLVILDEPTAGLDLNERIRFRNLISRWGENRTVIISTHIVGDIEASCDQVTVMHQGRAHFSGALVEVAQLAENHVWETKISIQEADRLFKEKVVVASRKEGNQMALRIVSKEKPLPDAEPVNPELEDGYVAILKGVKL
jgi:ABC-2 type transport system ATP-binding protein